MNFADFEKRVMMLANIQDKEVAQRGIQIVLSILSHRLTPEESRNVEDQLPHEMKRMWNNHVWITNLFRLSNKRLKFRHRAELLSIVENEILRENLPLNAEILTKSVFHALKESIAPGESEDISAQLPDEIREFFKAA